MTISALGALRLANYPEWKRVVREALKDAKAIPAAIRLLKSRGYGTSRAVFYGWLRAHPEVVEGLDLPPPKGLARGEDRQDRRPGWAADDKNIYRKNRRHGVSTKGAP